MNANVAVNETVVYTERYVAFVDVLGFRSIISKSATNPAVVERVHAALAGISRLAAARRSTTLGFEVTSFSDNVVLSIPVSPQGLLHLIQTINGFSQDLLGLGMLFRGAVVRGFALHTHEVIFGPGMVEAYQLESTISFHPRIMLGPAVLADARKYAQKQKLWREAFPRYIVEEPRDIPYLSPFASWPDDDAAWADDAVAKLFLLRTIIESGLIENSGTPHVSEKYRWLARQLNSFIRQHRLANHIPFIDFI
ncbi:hypothetical protein [Azospirillum aestuarii]|uniref:hypothetical protein n=1 Tax=Azospirillum aestuarii TaxID=2802052 RepID=UPI0040551DC2